MNILTRNTIILLLWTLLLCVLGVKSLVTGDSRFGRNMFHQQVNYKISYSYEGFSAYSDLDGLVASRAKGKTRTRFAPNERHQSRYGRGTIKHQTRGLLREIASEHEPEQRKHFKARITYKINQGPEQYTVISY